MWKILNVIFKGWFRVCILKVNGYVIKNRWLFNKRWTIMDRQALSTSLFMINYAKKTLTNTNAMSKPLMLIGLFA